MGEVAPTMISSRNGPDHAFYGGSRPSAKDTGDVLAWLQISSGVLLLAALPIAVAQGDTIGLVTVVGLLVSLLGAATASFVRASRPQEHRLASLGSWSLGLGLMGMCVLFFIAFAAIVALLGALAVGVDRVASSADGLDRTIGVVLLAGPMGVGVVLAVSGGSSDGSFMAMTWCTAVSLGLGTAGLGLADLVTRARQLTGVG